MTPDLLGPKKAHTSGTSVQKHVSQSIPILRRNRPSVSNQLPRWGTREVSRNGRPTRKEAKERAGIKGKGTTKAGRPGTEVQEGEGRKGRT